jgi:hypothetical protein
VYRSVKAEKESTTDMAKQESPKESTQEGQNIVIRDIGKDGQKLAGES